MKKILWFAFGLALLTGLGSVVWNTWQTTVYFQENGQTGGITIGKKYNASRWTSPIPLKKLHAYTAVLAPHHEVLIESDQALTENSEYFIRFLLRDTAEAAREWSIRPLASSIRLKAAADGTPVKLSDTDIFDRVLDKAMGPVGPEVYVRPRAVAEAAPSHEKPTVPFLLAGAEDSTLEIVWRNTTVGELIIAGLWLLMAKIILLHAWTTPFNPSRRTGVERKDFVHPSLRRIDADAPDTPSAKLTYTPKPDLHDDPAPAPPPRTTIPAPASTKDGPRRPAPIVSTATTAPFVPPAQSEAPTLKLARKPKP